jgi:hypothetical protein
MALDFDFANATKDSLEEYAGTLGITLDLRKPLDKLIKEVQTAVMQASIPLTEPAAGPQTNPEPKPRFLRHPQTKRVFEWTDALFEHGLLPCDQNGNSA